MDLGSRNSAIGILVGINVICFLTWVITLFIGVTHPRFDGIPTKLFEVFNGAYTPLLLALRVDKDPPK